MEAFAYIYNPYLDRASYYTLQDQQLGEQLQIVPWHPSEHTSYAFYLSNPFPMGFSWDYAYPLQDIRTIDREEHMAYVLQIVQHLRTSGLKKVVAARQRVLPLPRFSVEEMLLQLIRHFPKTFVYAFYTPQSGLWIGASPELLGYVTKEHFTTISLAGTTDGDKSFVTKEIDEERWVRDYIYQILKNNSSFIQEEQKELPYGTLKHLVTEFRSVLKDSVSFASLIHEIHPSPALSGFPKQEAVDYINRHEPIDRRYYTGHIIQTINNDHQYAFGLIRTALCADQQMVLYAGGGITIDSDPALEYEETEKKMNSLLRILKL